MPEELAFVALGSNLGDSPRIITRAFAALQLLTRSSLLRSSLWKTAPVDCPPGSSLFLNAVAGLRTRPGETPESLLSKLQDLEKQFGREASTVRNAPRPLDLDLLAFGARQLNSPKLTLPHPRAHLRRFVLAPWNEIAPNFEIPGHASIAELLDRLPPGEIIEKLRPAS